MQTPTAAHTENVVPTIKRFIVLDNDRESPDDSVNKARQTLFTIIVGEIGKKAPIEDSLHQHVLRTGYWAGLVWSEAPQLPSPAEFGFM